MFTPGQYREKAVGYRKLVKTANGPNERREFQELEQRFTVLADNEQWHSDNHDNTVRAAAPDRNEGVALAQEEEYILRCLGAALILQWNTLPRKLRRELFDHAGAMGEMLETVELRGKIARFLHKHKNDEGAVT
jgi:rubrerythrin